MTRTAFLALLLAASGLPGEDGSELDRIRQVNDLTKRSRRALQYAQSQLKSGLDAYQAHDPERGRAQLALVAEAVELAEQSLRLTGKHPRRYPRHFKYAEITTRKVLAELREGRQAAIFQDQADFDDPIRRVEAANDALLRAILSPRQ